MFFYQGIYQLENFEIDPSKDNYITAIITTDINNLP